MSMRNDNSFYCCICSEVIASGERRDHHFEKHICYNRFNCLECDSKFTSYGDLECHQECLQHAKFEKTTNIVVCKLVTSLMELSSKMAASPDMDSVELSVTVKAKKSKTSDSESTISDDSGEEAFVNDDSEDESLISKRNTEVFNSIIVEKDNHPNNRNTDKPIRMKQPEYLCFKTLGTNRFRRTKNLIINKCRCCSGIFGSERNKIEHVLRDHMKLKELRVLQCMYCLNQEGKSKKFLDISSVQDHYTDVHKFPKRGCPINLAHDYKGKEFFIHVNGSDDLSRQYETQFNKCFVKYSK